MDEETETTVGSEYCEGYDDRSWPRHRIAASHAFLMKFPGYPGILYRKLMRRFRNARNKLRALGIPDSDWDV